jgi:ABC-type phosphonate transport system ATPase subunit
MKRYGAYDPETVELLRTVLDEAWGALQPHYRDQISKSRMAEFGLRQAASGERHPGRLRFRAIADAVQEIAAA